MHGSALPPGPLEALRMRDSPSRGHPVDFPGTDHLLNSGRVAVHDLARKHVRHGRQADMRMRSHVGIARQALRQLHRTQMVEEYEGTHHVPVWMRQDAANLEAPEAAAALIDQ